MDEELLLAYFKLVSENHADLHRALGELNEAIAAVRRQQEQVDAWIQQQARSNQELRALFQELLDRVKGGGVDEVREAMRQLLEDREEDE